MDYFLTMSKPGLIYWGIICNRDTNINLGLNQTLIKFVKEPRISLCNKYSFSNYCINMKVMSIFDHHKVLKYIN